MSDNSPVVLNDRRNFMTIVGTSLFGLATFSEQAQAISHELQYVHTHRANKDGLLTFEPCGGLEIEAGVREGMLTNLSVKLLSGVMKEGESAESIIYARGEDGKSIVIYEGEITKDGTLKLSTIDSVDCAKGLAIGVLTTIVDSSNVSRVLYGTDCKVPELETSDVETFEANIKKEFDLPGMDGSKLILRTNEEGQFSRIFLNVGTPGWISDLILTPPNGDSVRIIDGFRAYKEQGLIQKTCNIGQVHASKSFPKGTMLTFMHGDTNEISSDSVKLVTVELK